MGIAVGKLGCRAISCHNASVISFAGRELCLDHFLSSCFERLDDLKKSIDSRLLDDPGELRKIQDSLEECSNQTLVICLRYEPLSNLERSRLLGILLQCEEFRQLLLRPLFISAPCD